MNEGAKVVSRFLVYVMITIIVVIGIVVAIDRLPLPKIISVDFTFDVPQKYNAPCFEIDYSLSWVESYHLKLTPFPYTVNGSARNGSIVTFKVTYYVFVQPQPEQDFNGTNIMIAPVQPYWQIRGREEFRVLIIKQEASES